MSDRHVFPPYSLRMPVTLREHLEKVAGENHRSLNAEIVARLLASVEVEQAALEVSLNPDPTLAPTLLRSLNDSISHLHQEIHDLQGELEALHMERVNETGKEVYQRARQSLREAAEAARRGEADPDDLSSEEKAIIVSWVLGRFLDAEPGAQEQIKHSSDQKWPLLKGKASKSGQKD
ncbi:Arc family DNA-binding protein [Pseudomonas aeruginosa]|nr:Arc family DNA-binding protein [Pseudomonas aeruginosa]MBG4718164.1 Arc family DNA-binding protein [Pseudomonas aeruginosa]